MALWCACTVLVCLVLKAAVVGSCFPASSMMPVQDSQFQAQVLQHIGYDVSSNQDILQCLSNTCDSTKSVEEMLQQHWARLHDYVQPSQGAAAADPMLTDLLALCNSGAATQLCKHTQCAANLQHVHHWACDQAVYVPAVSANGPNPDCHPEQQQQYFQHQLPLTEHIQHQQQLQCSACGHSLQQAHQLPQLQQPQEVTHASSNIAAAQQQQHHWRQQQQQHHVGVPAKELFWPLVGLQQLWEHLRHDTQMVQQQLDKGARISGQACKSCLQRHIHRSQREVLLEVIALLLLGGVCASALLLAAKMYKRRQKLRRHPQSSISAHRLRQLEKLHLQQQHQAEQEQQLQQQLAGSQQQQLPQLKQHSLSSKHERHKSHESILPSSPSASSSHSEVIGTAVSSRQKPGKASRVRSVQREQKQSSRQPTSAKRHLGRSHSDISTEAVEHSNLSVHSMAESLTGSTAYSHTPLSEPSTPTSTADSSNAFLSGHDFQHRHKQAPDPSTSAASTPKPSTSKRRHKHKHAASKPPPSKRRFIPGLDEEFDENVHELPTPALDSATQKSKQKGSVGSVGSSNPSASPLPTSAVPWRRRLSASAAPFIPNGYAQNCSLGTLSPHQDDQWSAAWNPQYASPSEPAFPYEPMQPQTPVPGPSSHPFSPRPVAYSPASSSHPLPHDLASPSMASCYHSGEQASMLLAPPGVPRPTSRHSPTSVLRWAADPQSSHMSGLSPRWSSEEDAMPSSLISNPSGVLLPPVLEDVISSPFPGMGQSRISQLASAPHQGTAPHSVSSALLDLPRQLPVSSVGLPGFNSIWSTSALPAAGQSSSTSWSISPSPSSVW